MHSKMIHPSIKEVLGYEESISDKLFLKSWKKKLSLICKPCWELKYCPYGPFVEQSPLLPILRKDAIKQINYLKKCLETNTLGEVINLSEEELEKEKYIYSILKENPRFTLIDIFKEMRDEEMINTASLEGKGLHELYAPPLENLHKYQIPFPFQEEETERRQKFLDYIMNLELTPELKNRIKNKLTTLETVINTGVKDYRKPLDSLRRKAFEKDVANFSPEKYPEIIPEVIRESECNIFGHVCPVFFVAESITETTEKRRRGRYISFKTKMRVVRRDNYTCQECGKHLMDNEVEFDHIIPVSKGGSSEEHNIRLTCFDCNREKTDKVNV